MAAHIHAVGKRIARCADKALDGGKPNTELDLKLGHGRIGMFSAARSRHVLLSGSRTIKNDLLQFGNLSFEMRLTKVSAFPAHVPDIYLYIG